MEEGRREEEGRWSVPDVGTRLDGDESSAVHFFCFLAFFAFKRDLEKPCFIFIYPRDGRNGGRNSELRYMSRIRGACGLESNIEYI